MQRAEQINFRTPGAADYCQLAPSTMAKMRMRGDGPAYSKAGPRIVIYARADLDAWLAARRRNSTSEFRDAPDTKAIRCGSARNVPSSPDTREGTPMVSPERQVKNSQRRTP